MKSGLIPLWVHKCKCGTTIYDFQVFDGEYNGKSQLYVSAHCPSCNKDNPLKELFVDFVK